MEFLSVNWAVILFAGATGLPLGYLWFDSALAEKWNARVKTEDNQMGPGWKRYLFLFLFSAFSALLFWFLYDFLGSVMWQFGLLTLGH